MFERQDLITVEMDGDKLSLKRSSARQQVRAQVVYMALANPDGAALTEDLLDTMLGDLSGAIRQINGQSRQYEAEQLEQLLTAAEIVRLWAEWHRESGLGESKGQPSPGS